MFDVLGWLGYALLALALFWLARLSQRLGRVTQAAPYYVGLYAAAGLVSVGALVRLVDAWRATTVPASVFWVLVYNGVPTLGLTVGVVFAWRYWSWLFAERD